VVTINIEFLPTYARLLAGPDESVGQNRAF